MSGDEILCSIRNHIAFVTLNRPLALNALTLDMISGLRNLLLACAKDVRVYAVLLAGSGDKAFCAGGDIRALYQSIKDAGSLHRQFFVAEYSLDYLLYSYPKPLVAVMNGITMGGGMGISQGCRLRLVGDRTRIAMPEVGIGLFPDVGASYFLPRTPGSLGTYLALTGSSIRAADALYAGLADLYLESATFATLADDLGRLQWSADPRADVQNFFNARATPVASARSEAPSLESLQPAIDRHFSQASIAGILASLEDESRPEFADWAERTADLIMQRSPTMLSVTLQQLSRGKSMSLGDCFRMELGMVQRCFEHGDFVEGVRAVIIDKDNTPHWRPSRLVDVAPACVDAFFSARWAAPAHPLAGLESAPD